MNPIKKAEIISAFFMGLHEFKKLLYKQFFYRNCSGALLKIA
jgi:hypothetical protein